MTRILCVDDNDHNLYLLDTLLKRAGFDVIVARTGEEAVALAVAQRPDLVFMDLTLPGIDGCEATRRIRAAPEMRGIPIVALSGHDEEEKGALARAAGCDGYLCKAIRVRVLLSMVNDLLAESALPPRAAAGGGDSR